MLVSVLRIFEWLDAIDGGPHPIDPLARSLRKVLAADAIRDLARFAAKADQKRRLGELGRRLGVEGARELQGAVADDDNTGYGDPWHPPIPKWGGRELALSKSADKWLDALSPELAAGLLEGAVAAIEAAVAAKGRGR